MHRGSLCLFFNIVIKSVTFQYYDCHLSNTKFQMNYHLHCDSCFDITCPLYKSIPCFLALTSHILFVSLYSYALRMNNKFFLLILCNMRKLILILVTAEKSFLQTRISPCIAWHETEKLQYSTNEQTSQYGTWNIIFHLTCNTPWLMQQ